MLQPSKMRLYVLAVFLTFGPCTARADDNSTALLQALQTQITTQQKELEEQQKLLAAQQQQIEALKSAYAESAKTKEQAISTEPTEKPQSTGGVKVTVGGFVEAAAIDRSKNETTDVASNFNTAIPFNNSVNAHQSEFRASARQSRITLLAEGQADENTALAAYGEADFLGAAPTANSTESNSYNPRLRVLYATLDQSDIHTHVLAGQEWSLLTTNKQGINARQENIPMTIDAQYVPGFNWTRNPQIRIAQDFDDKHVWLALSAESPQANLGGITAPATVNATNTGTSPLSTAAYSTDFAPDIIAKAAFDPGWGHYEVFGLTRFFHDNVLATDHNNEVVGYGGGAAAILPVVPKWLDVQANFMMGDGIGRYGSAQLPDFAFSPGGGIRPLTEFTSLVGAVGHPTPAWDTYLYAGYEGVRRDNNTGTTYGYGDYGLSNAGCNIENGSCSAQTSSVWQITGGIWDRIFEGSYGKAQIGIQDSLTRRNAFSDASGVAPHANENILMTSFRFYPK